MIILFLDDDIGRHDIVENILGKQYKHTILHAYNVEDFLFCIKGCQARIGVAMFDHDLADFDENGKERTGSTAAYRMIDEVAPDKLPAICLVHSNSPASENILAILRSGEYIDPQWRPFSEEMIKRLAEQLVEN